MSLETYEIIADLAKQLVAAQKKDALYWKDFISTIAGWGVSARRISRILGKEVGQKYRRSWAYDESFNQ